MSLTPSCVFSLHSQASSQLEQGALPEVQATSKAVVQVQCDGAQIEILIV